MNEDLSHQPDPKPTSVSSNENIIFQDDNSPDDSEDTDFDLTQDFDKVDVSAAQEETRAKIALYFTKFFLIIITISVSIPFVANFIIPNTFTDPLNSSKELVTLLASVLAGPFGFIVGFYFKQGNNNG